MEVNRHKDIRFELVSEDGVSSYLLNKKRTLVGAGESCDLVINEQTVEGVHAVIEVIKNSVRIYDMNTADGTFVNGQTAIVKEAHGGDQICFGSICYRLDSVDASVLPDDTGIPPILLNQNEGQIPPVGPLTPKRINKENKADGKKGSYDKVEFPLENYPNADKLEYIFEMPEYIKNILHYDLYDKAIEITITNGAKVFSIDYLDASNDRFYLSGENCKNGVVLPYLAKSEKVVFLECLQGKHIIKKIDGFDLISLNDSSNNEFLDSESLVVFLSDAVKVFVRLSDAPPRTLIEPFIENDKIFWKYLLLVLGIVFAFLLFIGIMDVNEDLKEKKAPQKLASILYKKPVLSISVDKTRKKNKMKAQKSPRKTKQVKKRKVVKNKTFRKKKTAKSFAKKKSIRAAAKKK